MTTIAQGMGGEIEAYCYKIYVIHKVAYYLKVDCDRINICI